MKRMLNNLIRIAIETYLQVQRAGNRHQSLAAEKWNTKLISFTSLPCAPTHSIIQRAHYTAHVRLMALMLAVKERCSHAADGRCTL